MHTTPPVRKASQPKSNPMTDAVIVCWRTPWDNPKSNDVRSIARICPLLRCKPANKNPRKASSSQTAGTIARTSRTLHIGAAAMIESNCMSMLVVCSPSLYSDPTKDAKPVYAGCKLIANNTVATSSLMPGLFNLKDFRTERVRIVAMINTGASIIPSWMTMVDCTIACQLKVMPPNESLPKNKQTKISRPQSMDSFGVGVSSRCRQTLRIHCVIEERSISRNMTFSLSNCLTAQRMESKQHRTVTVATVGK